MLSNVELQLANQTRSLAQAATPENLRSRGPETAPVTAEGDSGSSTQVQISAAARWLAQQPNSADQLVSDQTSRVYELRARDLAYPTSAPAQEQSNRLSSVTQAEDSPSDSLLARRMTAVQNQRIALYEQEKARGTSAEKIYAKLCSFDAAQPIPYK